MNKEEKRLRIFYGLVKQGVKLIRGNTSIQLAFFYIEAKQKSVVRRFFHVDKKKSLDPKVKFASPKKIATYLELSQFEPLGSSCRSCAGYLLWRGAEKDQLTLQIETKKGISAAHLRKMVTKINNEWSLGLPKSGLDVVDGEEANATTSGGELEGRISYMQALKAIYFFRKKYGEIENPPLALLEKLQVLVDAYLDIEPEEAVDSKPDNEKPLLWAEQWLDANWTSAQDKEAFQEQVSLTPEEMKSLAEFYRYIKKNGPQLLAETFAVEADAADQQLRGLEDSIGSLFQRRFPKLHISEAPDVSRPPKPNEYSSIARMAIDECLYPELRQFVATKGADIVATLFPNTGPGEQEIKMFLRHSSRFQPSIRLLLEENLIIPYKDKLENLLSQHGGAVSEADQLRQELDGSAVNERIRKALFTVVNGEKVFSKIQQGKSTETTVKATQKKTRTKIAKKLGPIIDDFQQLVRQLEGSSIVGQLDKTLSELRAGTSELAYGVVVELPGTSFRELAEQRFGGFNVLTWNYLDNLLKTGHVSNMWSMINALGLVANSHTDVKLVVDILQTLSPAEIRAALAHTPVREKLSSLVKGSMMSSASPYAPLLLEYMGEDGMGPEDPIENDEQAEAQQKGHRIALTFYCMMRDSYSNLSAAIEMLKRWLKESSVEQINAVKKEFLARFKELAGLMKVKCRFSKSDGKYCWSIIEDYVAAQEQVESVVGELSACMGDTIDPEDVAAITEINTAIHKQDVQAVTAALQALTPQQRKLHMAILLDDQIDRRDLFNPSMSEKELQQLSQKACDVLAKQLTDAQCGEAIGDAENLYVFAAPEGGIHAEIRNNIDSLSIKDISKKIYGSGAVETELVAAALQTLLLDSTLLHKIRNKKPTDKSQEFLHSLGVYFDDGINDFVAYGEAAPVERKALSALTPHELADFQANYDAALHANPAFWSKQIESSLKVLIRTKEDMSKTTQLVYKAQAEFGRLWEQWSDEEKKQQSKQEYIDQQMQHIWGSMSKGCKDWLESRPLTSKLAFSKKRKKQILNSLRPQTDADGNRSTTPLAPEAMLSSKGKGMNVSLTDMEKAFQVMSAEDLLRNYSNYQQLRPLTSQNEALSTAKTAMLIRISDLQNQVASMKENPGGDNAVLEERLDLLVALQVNQETHNQQVTRLREQIDGFTLDISPAKIELLWDNAGKGRSNARKKSLLNLVRKQIAHAASHDDGKRFLARELPGYAVDCLMENKLLVLADLTIQKSKDTGAQYHAISNASALRNEGVARLLGVVRKAHVECVGIEDETERTAKREEETVKIIEKRVELKQRTDRFDAMRKNATRVIIGAVSIIASIGIAIATAGAAPAAQMMLMTVILVGAKSTLIEAVRKGLEGDDFAMREAVARISANTLLEYLGGHLGEVATELANRAQEAADALQDAQVEAFMSSDMNPCLREMLHADIAKTPLKPLLEPLATTALSTVSGSLVGSLAQTLAENEGGLKSGLRNLRGKLEEEFSSLGGPFMIELTKTILTSGDGLDKANFGALHDSIVNITAAGSAKHSELDGGKHRFKLEMAEVEQLATHVPLLRELRAQKDELSDELKKLRIDMQEAEVSFRQDGLVDETVLVRLYETQSLMQNHLKKFRRDIKACQALSAKIDLLFDDSSQFSDEFAEELRKVAQEISNAKDDTNNRKLKLLTLQSWDYTATEEVQVFAKRLQDFRSYR